MLASHFSSLSPFRPTQSLTRGINQQFDCTGVIIYDKTRQLFFVSVDKQRFWGFEMTASLRDTSLLSRQRFLSYLNVFKSHLAVNYYISKTLL